MTALGEATARLSDAGVPSPEHDARELLAHVLRVPRLRVDGREDLTEAQCRDLAALVDRRSRREPLQHLLGAAAFRYVEVEVGAGVFVPRPETELLAGWAIEQLAARRRSGVEHPVAVDLCTGSGAIAKALADEQPRSRVYAVELSEPALEYASRNLAGTGVDLRAGDIADCLPELDGRVDVVVVNPPYIPLTEYESVAPEAREHDPAIALWSGEDGLDTIRLVERVAGRLLRPGGVAGCEHADSQGDAVPAVFTSRPGWCDVRDHRDLADRPRFTTARRCTVGGWHDVPVSEGKRFSCADDEERQEGLEAAVTALRSGKLVVMPTDTVYGLAADAFDPAAVRRLLRAKGRGRDMPPPVLVAAPTTLDALATKVPQLARELVEEFWPGPLTLICRQQTSLTWDLGDTRSTVAVRMPANDHALELLRRTGPLAVSSANRTGRPAASTVDEAEEMLGASVQVYLDGGPADGGVASTILDMTASPPRVLREGAIELAALKEFDEQVELAT